jgi:DNA-binding Lrp family transcriptional regulator
MSKSAQVRELLINNPSMLYRDIAIQAGTTPGVVSNISQELVRKGIIPKRDTSRMKTDTHIGLEEECQTVGIPLNAVSNYWYKGKHYSIHAKANELSYLQAIEDIIQDLPKRKLKVLKTPKKKNLIACKATLSDMHIGLDPNPGGRALFGYEYNAQIFCDNLNKVYNSILKEYNRYGKFDLLVLDDLGDGLDGWNGQTTRGGHVLPQNMDNVTSFKTYVFGKLDLIERLVEAGVANKIYVRNVSNCNHSGDFGYTANIAIQMILERTYHKEAVEFYILEKFMEHFEYGDHTFILTHGKDREYMKHGLPYKLDNKAIKFISDYIEHYGIRSKYVHVEKGDLHQIGYDRTKRFDYRNFMSFAPPSAWQQNNFGDSYSGYSIQVIPKHENEVSHTDYFFEFVKSVKAAV